MWEVKETKMKTPRWVKITKTKKSNMKKRKRKRKK